MTDSEKYADAALESAGTLKERDALHRAVRAHSLRCQALGSGDPSGTMVELAVAMVGMARAHFGDVELAKWFRLMGDVFHASATEFKGGADALDALVNGFRSVHGDGE